MTAINPKPWGELTGFHTPRWLRDKKFGIYTHWGAYSVAACGENVSWYPCRMYQEGTPEFEFHRKTFGHPSKVGYKDLIPRFDGAKFDADEWAEIFAGSGAQFAGPVAEHHDGFALWPTKLSRWNAQEMGPKRDVVGELERAYRKKGMEFLTAFHHAENWRFYPHWVKEYDCSNPEFSGLYGEIHNMDLQGGVNFWNQDLPNKAAHELWLGKLVEVVDAYNPDFVWFDFGLDFVNDWYKRAFLTYYFDRAAARKQEVVVSYKSHHLPVGAGLIDLELGRFSDQTYNDWITDTTIDDGEAWGYKSDANYRSAADLIHYLVDNVSKNGYLLLNVGPKPNGEIPEEAKKSLAGMGDWLRVNGEAVYGTRPWVVAGEGPTVMESSGDMSERKGKVKFVPEDIRFTLKDDSIYAHCLGEIGDEVIINSLAGRLYPGEIASITLLGDGGELRWKIEGQKIIVNTAACKRRKDANVLKIKRNMVYR
jgi:alpha-L-fucosidase